MGLLEAQGLKGNKENHVLQRAAAWAGAARCCKKLRAVPAVRRGMRPVCDLVAYLGGFGGLPFSSGVSILAYGQRRLLLEAV